MKALIFLVSFLCLILFLPDYCLPSASEQVIVITIEDGIINPITSEYIKDGIEKAYNYNAQALIIKLDTPGGLLTTTRKIVKDIMEDKVVVIVYVSPKGARAASAGTFITLASHIAVMSPATNIGAARPVVMGEGTSFRRRADEEIEDLSNKENDKKNIGIAEEEEEEEEEEYEPRNIMSEKIMADTIAWIRGIAETRGRNAEWAVDAVRKSVSIGEKEALELGVIDLIASDIRELLEKIDGMKINIGERIKILHTKDAEIVNLDMTLRQRILNAVTHPNIAYMLIFLGFYGLLHEITRPGFGISGIAGLICLTLAFYALHVLPVNFAGLGLIILALILFVAEMFTPTFGLLTMGGIISMVIGSLMFIDSPYQFMQVSLKVILPIVIATSFITLLLIGSVLRTRKNKILVGCEGLIGERGEVTLDIAPRGKIFVHGEIWNAVSIGEAKITKGEEVEVTRVEGLKVIVKKVQDEKKFK